MACISVKGPDAQDWLNRILSNKITDSMANPLGGAYLDYRGRALCIFIVKQNTAEEYHLYCDKSQLESSLQHLDMALFGEEIEVAQFKDEGFLSLPLGPSANEYSYLSEPGDTDVVLSSSEYLNYTFRYGYLSKESIEKQVFIESQSYLDYIHEDKGCYPGQEVINKILSMGQVPKTYCVFSCSEQELNQGTEVKYSGKSLGKLIHFGAWQNESFLGLFIRKKLADELPESFNAELDANNDIELKRLF